MNWISVKDQLPDPEQWIIYHAPDIFSPDTSAQMWIGKYDGQGAFYSRQGFFGGGEVTHWMPVPLLPHDQLNNIKAGAEIHAGFDDLPLEEGTREGYEAFVKARNYSYGDNK